MSFRISLWFFGLTALAAAQSPEAHEPPADWWTATPALDPRLEARDDAPATLGQLKWIAALAHEELERSLINGAGFALPGFAREGNAAAATVGQGKHLASLFWERLHTVSEVYCLEILRARWPGWEHPVPWDPESAPAGGLEILTAGQLKSLFCFPTRPDADGDGLTDWQEFQLSGDRTQAQAEGDVDGDGYSNLLEIHLGTGALSASDNPQSRIERERAEVAAAAEGSGRTGAEVYTPLENRDGEPVRGIFHATQAAPPGEGPAEE